MVAALVLEVDMLLNWLLLLALMILIKDIWDRRGEKGWRRRDDDY